MITPLPSMFVINKGLTEMKGLSESPYPRTESQLVSKIVSGTKGEMKIITLKDCFSYEALKAINERPEGCAAGVFGMVSRRTCFENKLSLDYVLNGFESCMAECLRGKDAILICDADCLDLIKSKIDALKEFGSDVPYSVIE